MLDKLAPSAKIVDGILVLTLPDAVRPVVWQMELGQTKSSAMEVRELNDGTFVLMLKTPRQDVQEIAPYAKREQAVRALITVSKALENAQGVLRGANSNNPNHLPVIIPATAAGRSKLGRIAIGLVIVAALVFLLTRIGPPGPASLNPAAGPASSSSAPATAGEPLSAEDYLNQ